MKKTLFLLVFLLITLLNFAAAIYTENLFSENFKNTYFYSDNRINCSATNKTSYSQYMDSNVANNTFYINISATDKRFYCWRTDLKSSSITALNFTFEGRNTTYFNTNGSLILHKEDAGSSFMKGFYYEFPTIQNIKLGVGSHLKLYNGFWDDDGGVTLYSDLLIFVGADYRFRYGFEFGINSSCANSEINISNCCKLADYDYDLKNEYKKLKLIDINYSVLSWCNISQMENIRGFAIGTTRGNNIGSDYIDIYDDINFTYYNGTNDYPEVNFTVVNPYACLINDTVEIVINTTSYDQESDTIYYATQRNLGLNKTNVYNFGNYKCLDARLSWSCWITNQYTAPYWFYINNHSSPPVLLEEYSEAAWDKYKALYDKEGYYFITQSEYSPYGTDSYLTLMLLIHNVTTFDDKSVYFKLPTPSTKKRVGLSLWGLRPSLEKFNVTLYDDQQNILSRVEITSNADNVTFYHINDSGLGEYIGKIAFRTNFSLFIDKLESDKYDLRVLDSRNDSVLLSDTDLIRTASDSDVINSWSLTIDYGRVYLAAFTVVDMISSLNWQTMPPTNIITNNLGPNTVTFYYTDNIHLPEYKSYTANYYIYGAEKCPPEIYTPPEENAFEYSGDGTYFNKLMWFFRFPANFFRFVGIYDVAVLAIAAALLVVLIQMFIANHASGGAMSINSLILTALGMNIVLWFMDLAWTPMFIFVLFASSFVIYKQVVQGGQ